MLTKLSSGWTFRPGPPPSVDFTATPAVTAATLLGIIDPTTGLEIYVADDPTLGGVWQGRVLVLSGAPPSTAATDQFLIFVNDGRTPAGDDTLAAFAAAAHGDAVTALAVAGTLAADNTLKGVANDINNFATATHQDLVQLDADLKAAGTQAHTDAGTAHTDAAKLDTDLNALAAATHQDLVQLDTDLKAAGTQAHADAGTAHTDAAKLDADLNAFATATHQDLVQLDADLKAAGTQAHADAATAHTDAAKLDADLDAFAAATHQDLVQLDADLKAAGTQAHADAATAHSDATKLDTDLNAFAAATHQDLVQLDTDLKAAGTQAHADAATAHTDATKLDADLGAFATATHQDLVQLDADLKAAGTQAHADAQALLPFAPIRGATVALTVGPAPTANPVKLAANAATTYRVRNAATSPSPVTWALLTVANGPAPVIPTPYDATGAGGTAGDKTIDPGVVEIIALTVAQQAAIVAGSLYLAALCPAGGSALLSVTPGTGA